MTRQTRLPTCGFCIREQGIYDCSRSFCLLAEPGHGEGPTMLETSHELTIGSEEQVLAVAVEVVFGELIHCCKYIGTLIRRQEHLAPNLRKQPPSKLYRYD